MPSRGYRKGIDDSRTPLPRQIYTRTTDADHRALVDEADARNMTISKLTRAVLEAHLRHSRAELPQSRGVSSAALRELARIGNNLNQLARQANTGLVAVAESELAACLVAINDAARRIGA